MEPRGTPGAYEPSAAPRLIPRQTFQLRLDQPWMDRMEGIMWGGVEELGGFFYPGRVHPARGKTDLGVWPNGWWRFSAEGGLGEAVTCDWAES